MQKLGGRKPLVGLNYEAEERMRTAFVVQPAWISARRFL